MVRTNGLYLKYDQNWLRHLRVHVRSQYRETWGNVLKSVANSDILALQEYLTNDVLAPELLQIARCTVHTYFIACAWIFDNTIG